MVYTPTTWVDGTTSANAVNLNNIESGITESTRAGDVNAADYADLAACVTAAPAGSRIRLLPNTTYPINGLQIPKTLTFVGAGDRSTILDAGANAYGLGYGGNASARITFRDIGFTGSTAAVVQGNGNTTVSYRFIDCRFTGFTTHGIEISGTRLACYRCSFASDGNPGSMTAVWVGYGAQSINLVDCTARYLYEGLYCTATGAAPGVVTVTGADFDGGWPYLKSTASRAAGVTYTATTVTDVAASFPALTLNSTVRALAVKRAGTMDALGYTNQAVVSDASANFTTAAVKAGDIVRTATAWGVVASVISTTSLQIEEWLSLSNYEPVTPPGAVAYTVYGLVIGRVQSNTATVITVDAWRDWQGIIATPAAATLYETAPRGNYQIFIQQARSAKVFNGDIRRPWSDGISFQQCAGGMIVGNRITNSQDVGITVEDNTGAPGPARGILIANNTTTHTGTGGIFVGHAYASRVIGNTIVEPNWVALSQPSYGGINLENCVDVGVSGNSIARYLHPGSVDALRVTGTSDRVTFTGNRDTGFPTHLRLDGAGVTNVDGDFQPGATVGLANAAVGPRGSFSGAGVPALACSAGSTYRRTDGAAGSSFYVKETASSSTTWTAK